jgi:hypothetical protein
MQDLIPQLTNCEMNRLLFRFWLATGIDPLNNPDSATVISDLLPSDKHGLLQ